MQDNTVLNKINTFKWSSGLIIQFLFHEQPISKLYTQKETSYRIVWNRF